MTATTIAAVATVELATTTATTTNTYTSQITRVMTNTCDDDCCYDRMTRVAHDQYFDDGHYDYEDEYQYWFDY